jgi:hypothetical protein
MGPTHFQRRDTLDGSQKCIELLGYAKKAFFFSFASFIGFSQIWENIKVKKLLS